MSRPGLFPLEQLRKRMEGCVCRRYPAVDRLLKDDLFQFVPGEPALVERRPGVHAEFVEAAQCDQRAEDEHAPCADVEAGAGPDLAPRVTRDQVLKFRGVRRGMSDGAIDVRMSEHLPPDRHARLVTFSLIHARTSAR